MIMDNTCVAFGTFEFVHKGHKKIAEKVVEVAKEKGLTSVIVCIEDDEPVFTTFEEKEYLLKQLGVEMVVSFREIDPLLLLKILAAKVVVTGEHSSYLEMLQMAEGNFEIITVPSQKYHGKIISEEMLKMMYENSEYEFISKLCEHPYILIGEVVHGKALGRTQNMPTANIQVQANKILPKDAVYATSIRLGDEYLSAVTNIGKRPTVDTDDHVTIESLILDFDREIYGEKLVLEIREFVRDIKKFETLAEVKEQVDKDVQRVKRMNRRSNKILGEVFNMTKVDIISGFLGAGKTTFIKQLINQVYVGQKLVLIENEFGEIGIDGGFLQDAGIEITEMNSGCICCTLVGDFSKALKQVIDEYHPDRVIIEPSGVGKLSDVAKAVEEVKHIADIEIASKIAVVDGKKAKLYLNNFGEFFRDQVENASTIVISRTQMMTDEKIEECVHLLREENEHATIISTPWGQLEGEAIMHAIQHEDLNEHHHHEEGCTCGCGGHHHHDHNHEEGCTCGCGGHHHHDHDHEHHHHHHHHADEVFTSWGKDDSVTFSIEKKNGNKYRVAVRDSSTTVLQWYEKQELEKTKVRGNSRGRAK